jgi:hypothetical protein
MYSRKEGVGGRRGPTDGTNSELPPYHIRLIIKDSRGQRPGLHNQSDILEKILSLGPGTSTALLSVYGPTVYCSTTDCWPKLS